MKHPALSDRELHLGCGLITDQTSCDHREKSGTCACNDEDLCNGATNINLRTSMAILIAFATLFMHRRELILS